MMRIAAVVMAELLESASVVQLRLKLDSAKYDFVDAIVNLNLPGMCNRTSVTLGSSIPLWLCQARIVWLEEV